MFTNWSEANGGLPRGLKNMAYDKSLRKLERCSSPFNIFAALVGLAPLSPRLYCTREPSTGPTTPDAASPVRTSVKVILKLRNMKEHLIKMKIHRTPGWRLNHFPGQPLPMLDNPFSEEKFPNIQSKPPLAQLEAISSCPITCYLGEETNPHLSTTSFQAKQALLPQPLLIRLLLQTLHQLRCPSLDVLQHLNVFLVVRGPKLNTVFEPLFPKPVALHGAIVTQVQDLALGLVEPHTIGPRPLIQPVQIPLQSLPLLKQINTPAELGVICKLTDGALDPFVQIIDKDVKQDWPQYRALGNTTCDRPPTGVNSIHHHSLGPAIQPVLYPAKSTPVQAMSSQFLQENAVGNRVKGFTEV
ncbi:hypothetical protein QYF61_010143 [Mycteria americana]|uniref:Uncharacterized protein n=1 Tax=Mycteria americana TaxID=33587 RepID=A0AAN7NSV3_MYCAM|nr:hypothetical protein QYF61_010143 [Mycteria americana]